VQRGNGARDIRNYLGSTEPDAVFPNMMNSGFMVSKTQQYLQDKVCNRDVFGLYKNRFPRTTKSNMKRLRQCLGFACLPPSWIFHCLSVPQLFSHLSLRILRNSSVITGYLHPDASSDCLRFECLPERACNKRLLIDF